MNPVLVRGDANVTTKNARSRFAATTWLSCDRFTDLRTMQLVRSWMLEMTPVPSSTTSKSTMSPTATGLVDRYPFNLNFPLGRHDTTSPDADNTSYHDPVVRNTRPALTRSKL